MADIKFIDPNDELVPTDRIQPKTRLEKFLAKIAKREDIENLEPKTRLEYFLNKIAMEEDSGEILEPETRLEHLLNEIAENMSQPTGTIAITENGTVDVTEYASAEVAVETPPVPLIMPVTLTNDKTLNVKLQENTAIAAAEFMEQTLFKTVSIPSEVKTIKASAFASCSGLVSVDLNEIEEIQNYGFDACSNLSTIKIPKTCKKIGAHAFRNNSQLAEIIIPNSVTSITPTSFTGVKSGCVINCEFAEGTVNYAPWGATGATINYNVPYQE